MPLVTVKNKFQVTIPARLRRALALEVGDVMEAALEDDRIVLRPKAVIDRAALADRLQATLGDQPPAGASDDEAMAEAIAEVAAARAARRRGKR